MIRYCSLVVLLSFAPSVFSEDTNEKIKERITAISSPKTVWEERMRAENELKGMSAKDVLPALLPVISEGMPTGAIWNSGGPELDKEAPPQWQVFYAVHRTWKHHLGKESAPELGKLLLGMLPRATTAAGQLAVLRGMQTQWTNDAEEPVAKMLRDDSRNHDVRTSAAGLLIMHTGMKYHDEVLKTAETSKAKLKELLWGILAEPPHSRQSGVDASVVRMGFALMEEELNQPKPYVAHAYFIALRLEDYLQRTFKPDQNDPKYRATGGLDESYFRDTVSSAVQWWSKHRDRLKVK